MKSKFSLIIDFDSTIIGLETLECLADIVLSTNSNKDQIINKISSYTKLAMNGELSFEKSLEYRFNLMKASSKHIVQTIDKLKGQIDKSFLENLDFFKENKDDIYIVSGGFYSIIDSVLLSTTNIKWNIFANTLIFNKDNQVIGVDKKNPLAYSMGKVNLVKSLNLDHNVIIVGDGYTDYEIKKYNAAKHFLAYTKYVTRSSVIDKADMICNNFNQVVNFVQENYS